MEDTFNLSLLQLFYDILTKTQKYIKPPPKLHDTDHAPNVADIPRHRFQYAYWMKFPFFFSFFDIFAIRWT
mgnify:CR=1 FL=1